MFTMFVWAAAQYLRTGCIERRWTIQHWKQQKRIKSDNSTNKHTHKLNTVLFAFYLPYPICYLHSFSFHFQHTRKSILCLQLRWRYISLCSWFPPLIHCRCFSFHLNGVRVLFFRFYGTYFIPFYRCINVGFFTVYFFLYQNKKKCIKLFHFAAFGV